MRENGSFEVVDGEEFAPALFPNMLPFMGGFRYPASASNGPVVSSKMLNSTMRMVSFDALIFVDIFLENECLRIQV